MDAPRMCDIRLTKPENAGALPNDEGHLAVAFGVSVGRTEGFYGPSPWSASIAGAGFEPATFGL